MLLPVCWIAVVACESRPSAATATTATVPERVIRDQQVLPELSSARWHGPAPIEGCWLIGVSLPEDSTLNALTAPVSSALTAKTEPRFDIDLHERGIAGLDGESQRHERDVLRHLHAFGLQPVGVNALAFASSVSKRAGIDEGRFGGDAGGLLEGRHKRPRISLRGGKNKTPFATGRDLMHSTLDHVQVAHAFEGKQYITVPAPEIIMTFGP